MRQRAEWEDPRIIERHRETAHAPLGAYPDAASALHGDAGASPYRQSLNGTWQFSLVPSPAAVPEGFYRDDYDTSRWRAMPVPGNWQLFVEDDRPIYTNVAYPFPADPPNLPEQNPTGLYRHRFTLDERWRERQIFIVFDSVDSAFYLWVNGEQVGYSQDSRLPAEFNITDYVHAGENSIAVQVMRYSDGFYLEDQDYWLMSGIQRDVYLYSKPPVHLRDFRIRTTFDAAYRDALLSIDAYLSPHAVEQGQAYRVQAMLYDAQDHPVFDAPASAEVQAHTYMYRHDGSEKWCAKHAIAVPAPRQWSAEDPYLYTLVLTLLDPQGQAIDFERARVGFRQIEVTNRQVLINGQRMVVRGVNRHEHHPERGRALTEEDMLADVLQMKRLNFNAVRTSHYPNHPRWYELCDEYGLYVVDEANLETHGIEGDLSQHPAWSLAYLDRAVRMVLREKNHPCICFWSLGNESYYGPHHAAMAAWIRRYDPTRPVQYESGNPDADISDIMAPMYPTFDWIATVMADANERRPMITCEYAYAKGNASGNFAKYWRLVETEPSFQGGFIWDWADKALTFTLPDGRRVWGYGGDLGCGTDYAAIHEDPTQVLNGIVGVDLTPHPGAWEVKKAQAPLRFSATMDGLHNGRISCSNRYQFLHLGHLRLHWQLLADGVCVQRGDMPLPDIPAGETAELALPYTLPSKQGVEYWLNVSAVLAHDCRWAPAGHEISWEQFALPVRPAPVRPCVVSGTPALTLLQNADAITIAAAGWQATFNAQTGLLDAWQSSGRALLLVGPRENFYRAPTDNDYILNNPASYRNRWQQAGLHQLLREELAVDAVQLSPREAVVRVCAKLIGTDRDAPIVSQVYYTLDGSGEIRVEYTVDIPASWPVLPRIGVELVLPDSFSTIHWFGRGPWENYVDRKSAAMVGRYRSSVADMYFPYLRPGESGGREDVRWVALTDNEGYGVLASGLPTFHMDALPYRIEDLEEAGHYYELTPRNEIYLHLDARHMGVGGDTGWTPNVHDEYLIHPGRHHHAFRLRPLYSEDDPAELAK